MKLCDHVGQLKSPNNTLQNFLIQLEQETMQNTFIETCRFSALDTGQINQVTCVNCSACLTSREEITLLPKAIDIQAKIENAAFFQGSYINLLGELDQSSGTDETQKVNPLAAILLFRLSKCPEQTKFCCSPSQELSIAINTQYRSREGHLDIVIGSKIEKKIFVLEGKKDIQSLLKDQTRQQWELYYPHIQEMISEDWGFFMSYVCGGNEYHFYPQNQKEGVPVSQYHKCFKEMMDENKTKKFISLQALSLLSLLKLNNTQLNWENFLFNLFQQEDFVGLVSGGGVFRCTDSTWQLRAINF